MPKQFIRELNIDDNVDSYFAVKYKRPVRSYKKGYMFEIGLSDRTGEIDLTYWGSPDEGEAKRVWSSFNTGDVLSVRGKVSEYQDKKKIDVNKDTGRIEKTNEYSLGDFVGRSERDPDEMAAILLREADSVKNPFLKKLLDSFFKDDAFMAEFKGAPAAMYMHHAYIGGLLEHTLHTLELCEAIHRIYPSMDRDLLIVGALLHDIGKTREFVVGTSISVTEDGMLRGHLVIGEEMVLEKAKSIPGFPEVLRMKLLHVLLSHHGEGQYGSPKKPQFAEAAAVHYADEMDAKVDQYVNIIANTDSTDFRIYTKRLGELYIK